MSKPLTASLLRQLVALTERRDALLSEKEKVENQIVALIGKTATPQNRPKVGRRPTRKGRKGGIKGPILEALREAGPTGIRIKDLSAQLGLKNSNIHVWLATTGKSVTGLRRIGPGHYALS